MTRSAIPRLVSPCATRRAISASTEVRPRCAADRTPRRSISALVRSTHTRAPRASNVARASPRTVWEWITSPARRLQWQIGVDAVNEEVAGGRRGVGTTNHCVHGRDAIVEEVLAWPPPEVLTTRFQTPMPGVPKLTRSELFEATPDGAKTPVLVQRPSSAKDRAKLEEMAPFLVHAYGDGLGALVSVHVDEKLVDGDRLNDLTTVDIEGARERVQFKHRDNDDLPLTMSTFTGDTRDLALDRLVAAAIADRDGRGKDARRHLSRVVLREAARWTKP
jgi:uncharacterized protein YndB with AHSA1/START domain